MTLGRYGRRFHDALILALAVHVGYAIWTGTPVLSAPYLTIPFGVVLALAYVRARETRANSSSYSPSGPVAPFPQRR